MIDQSNLSQQLSEEDFNIEIAQVIKLFVESEESEFALVPMNSFFRRLAHKAASDFKLDTKSEGGEDDRHVVLVRTKDTILPKALPKKKEVLLHFGDQQFFVDPLQKEVKVYFIICRPCPRCGCVN